MNTFILRFFMSAFLSILLLGSSLPLASQQWLDMKSDIPLLSPKILTQKESLALLDWLEEQDSKLNVRDLQNEYNKDGFISVYTLSKILNNDKYIRSMSAEEATDLVYLSQFVRINADESFMVLDPVFAYLGTYKEDDPLYKIRALYELIGVSLGHNMYLHDKVLDRAFNIMNMCINEFSTPSCGWTAVLLSDLAFPDENGNSVAGERFERRMKALIHKMDYLKFHQADYKLTGVKNVLGSTNQGVLIQLFAQANSFFAAKDEDGFFKMMCTTGSLNGLARCVLSSEENPMDRFSDTGEVFYLSSPTPGTDGKGHFADSDNGQRHFILSHLIYGLFSSYYERDNAAASSALMKGFIKEYIQLNSKNDFKNYLYVALQGIRFGTEFHYASSLDGWDKEAKALQQELYANLKKGYSWTVGCTAVQGACEVAAEWIGVSKLLGWIGKGASTATRAAGRQIVKRMSARSLMRLAVADLTVRQGKKLVIRWTRKGFASILKQCGWKPKSPVRAK